MHRFAWFALFTALAFGQSNDPFQPKPPAEVDAALRARVQEFFDLHVKGQFRKAEELVAEDTKDFFYSGNKPKYLSFEISRIDYSANFTRAKVTVLCEQYILIAGADEGAHPQHLEAGEWQVVLVCGSGRSTQYSLGQDETGSVSREGCGAAAVACQHPHFGGFPVQADPAGQNGRSTESRRIGGGDHRQRRARPGRAVRAGGLTRA